MTRREAASWLLVSIVALGLASAARAATLPNTVRWNFVATASVGLGDPTCCQPVVSDGEKVFGSLLVTDYPYPPNPSTVATDMAVDVYTLDGTQHLFGFSTAFIEGQFSKLDGQPGVGPDQLGFFHVYIDDSPAAAIGVQPGWNVNCCWDVQFRLIDQDGTAWSGINPRTGDILPDTPPDATLFETREIVLAGFLVPPGSTNPTTSAGISFHIDQFLPEPGVTPLLGAALLALAALTASAARSPRTRSPGSSRRSARSSGGRG